jgi:hypothetical protein
LHYQLFLDFLPIACLADFGFTSFHHCVNQLLKINFCIFIHRYHIVLIELFTIITKYLNELSYKEERLILVHSFGVSSPCSIGPIMVEQKCLYPDPESKDEERRELEYHRPLPGHTLQ